MASSVCIYLFISIYLCEMMVVQSFGTSFVKLFAHRSIEVRQHGKTSTFYAELRPIFGEFGQETHHHAIDARTAGFRFLVI